MTKSQNQQLEHLLDSINEKGSITKIESLNFNFIYITLVT